MITTFYDGFSRNQCTIRGVLRDGDDPQQRATNDGEQEAHRKGAEGDLRAPKRYTQKVYLHRPIHFGVYNRLIETIIIIMYN